jgi:DNA-binding XRE family transcriptional regulator
VGEQIAQKSLSERLHEAIEAERAGQPEAMPNAAPPPDRNPTSQPSDFAWVRTLRDEYEASFQADFWTRLHVMPVGPRIRHLRRVLGWTQKRLADELRVSLRTVIRHERGQQHRRRVQWRWRLSELERDHGNQLLPYFYCLGS